MSRAKPGSHPVVAAAASLKVTVFALLGLLVLTVWGTLYQADHGLYEAQHRFYYSWYFLAGDFFPLPGAQLVMTVLFINLTASVIDLAGRRRLSGAFLLTHGGLVLMLSAGAVIFFFGEESTLGLLEGNGSNVSTSSREWELAVWPANASVAEKSVTAFSVAGCRLGSRIVLPESGQTFTVRTYYPNAMRRHTGDDHGLVSQPRAKEPPENRPGLVLTHATESGDLVETQLWGGDRNATVLNLPGEGMVVLALRRRTFVLPAVIELLDFQKEVYPGTQTPRIFASRVRLRDGNIEREVRISMNKPLRYKGFTFYQSSYQMLGDGQEASVLAVVKNYARHLPYVATLAVSLGMILHFTGRMVLYLRRSRKVPAKEAAV